ncbi:ATP-binding protein [Halovivax cerinus]|uniref:ATP-binding protein n=1 Tax=Halovivax cerinus TaxID=1487865 RepID=A0ABD5NPZ9_9EURY|nr:tetratricopeptide repeat protein [Halovivax cerinus]
MTAYSVEDLVLLALREQCGADECTAGATVSELGDVIGLSGTVADRLTLLSALSTLTGNGLVDETTGTVADRSGERSLYRLTGSGRRRATERTDAVGELPVTVHERDETAECRLGDVPERFDRSIAEALVRRAPSGDLYLPAESDDIVDRSDERSRLRSTFEKTLDGEPATVIVSGEAGVGKTTLVEAFAERARESGADVLVGRSTRTGADAYGPLRDAIEGAIGAADESPFADGWAKAADAEMYRTQRAALYSTVSATLADHARNTPTVLVIEDLQWADAATVDLLAHVCEELSDVPVLLVATYRPSGVADETPLDRRLAERVAMDHVVELALDPFDRERTGELVEAEVTRRGVPQSFVDAVYERTGGNALFVVETVAALLESGALDPRVDRYPDAVDDAEIPDVVETTIDRRFSRLDDETYGVVAVGAVLDDPITIDGLLAISSRPEPTVRERVDLLVDGGIWVRDDDTLRFRSEVLRSTALASIADDRRQSLHEGAAAYLADDESTPPATVASHYERAGDADRALEWYRRAAGDATEVYAHDVAVEHYERALSLARELDREAAVLDLLEGLGDIHATRGEYGEADRQFRYVRERTDDPERIRRSYRYQAKMAFESSRYDDAEEYAQAGLAVGEDDVTPEVCRLTDYLGSAYFGRGQYEEAIAHHERLRDRAAEIDCTVSLGRAYKNLGTCYTKLGELDRSVGLNERGVTLLEDTGHARELASALSDLAIAYGRTGDYDRAVDALERCDELAERTGNVSALVLSKMNRAVFAQWRGEYGTARERYADVREIAERIDDRDGLALAICNESLIDREVGRLEPSIAGFERALDLVDGTEVTNRITLVEWGLGEAHFLAADFDRAETHLDRALDLAVEHDFTRHIGACKSVMGAVERERGELDRAIELGRAGLDLVPDSETQRVLYLRMNRLAQTLLAAGDVDEALELCLEGRETIPEHVTVTEVKLAATHGAAQVAAGELQSARETLESTVDRARGLTTEALLVALCELGRLEHEAGDASTARDHLTEGRRIATDAGFRVFVPRFDEVLAEIDGGDRSDGCVDGV